MISPPVQPIFTRVRGGHTHTSRVSKFWAYSVSPTPSIRNRIHILNLSAEVRARIFVRAFAQAPCCKSTTCKAMENHQR